MSNRKRLSIGAFRSEITSHPDAMGFVLWGATVGNTSGRKFTRESRVSVRADAISRQKHGLLKPALAPKQLHVSPVESSD